MEESQDWIGPEHARPGIAHHLPNLFPHSGRIAMDLASAAGGLFCLKRAFLQTLARISEKGRALETKLFVSLVMVSAVAPDHQLHGFSLTAHPSCW